MLYRKISVIGASSTEGKVDPKGGGFVGRLKRWSEELSERNHVHNLGIAGDTVAGMLARIEPETKIRKTELIIIQTGLNDIARYGVDQEPVTNFEEYQNLIRQLFSKSLSIAKTIFVTPNPFNENLTTPVSWNDVYFKLDDAAKYVNVAIAIAKELQIPVIDNFNELIQTDYFKLVHSDGLHPNAEGHEHVFEKIRDLITKSTRTNSTIP